MSMKDLTAEDYFSWEATSALGSLLDCGRGDKVLLFRAVLPEIN